MRDQSPRRKLLLSTTMLVGALTGYSGRAYAACVQVGATSTFECSDAETTTQTITFDNANVVTLDTPGFSVDTTGPGGDALVISGDGAISYTDAYASPLTAPNAGDTALSITSTGDDGATPGSVTVDTDGTLTGGEYGIRALNYGSGALDVTANGDVTGTTMTGIFAKTTSDSGMTVTTGAGTTVSGGLYGIEALNNGNGAMEVTANGDTTGSLFGLYALNNNLIAGATSTDLTVTTGPGSTASGVEGIRAINLGIGTTMVSANGDATGTANGIYALNRGTDLSVTTGPGTMVSGGDFGIVANNEGSGALDVTARGDVTGTADAGIFANNSTGTDLDVTTGAGTTVTGGDYGIVARNEGSGALSIKAKGNVYGTTNDGIVASNSAAGTDLTITTGAGTKVIGDNYGIFAFNFGDGALTIKAYGDVTGTEDDGIVAYHGAGGPIDITVGPWSTVTSEGAVGNNFAIEIAGGPANVTVAGTLNGGSGGAVQFDQTSALDDRLELQPTAVVNGTVLAGLGTDTLAFGGSGDGAFNLGDIDTGADTEQYRDFELFQVDSGTWNFFGATTEAFTVEGGTVMGTGTFGGLTVNGGTVAPGNSIGTMIVNGPFTLGPGAIYEAEVNAAGQSDQIIVNGTVNLTGSLLQVMAANGNYKPSTDYVIIDNDGTDAVVGTFSQVTTNFAFLDPSVAYDGGDGNDVVLTLERNNTLFSDVARTRNQRAVAGALDWFPTGDPLFLAVLTQTETGARQAFDALSGEVHATLSGVLVDESRYVRDAVLGRLMQASYSNGNQQVAALGAGGPKVASLDASAMALGYGGKSFDAAPPPPSPGLAFWISGFGAWADFDSDGNAASADRDLGGFVTGLDASLGGSWRVGLATGYSRSNVSVDARHSSAEVDSYHLAAYAGGDLGPLALRTGGAWTWNDIDTSRAVMFPGFYEREKASYDGDTGQVFGELAYPIAMGSVAVEPFAGVAYVNVSTDSFRERGGVAALRASDIDNDVTYSTLGLRLASATHLSAMMVTPHISVAWQHAFDDVTPDAALAFASTGIGFTVYGVPLAEDSLLLKAGLDFNLGPNATAGVSYSGQLANDLQDNAVKGRLTWRF